MAETLIILFGKIPEVIWGAIIGASIVWLTSRFERLDRVKLVAVEKRLEVHQKAFTILFEIEEKNDYDSDDEIKSIIIKCRKFISENLIYLDNDSKVAFLIFFDLAQKYSSSIEPNKQDKIKKQLEEAKICIVKRVNLKGMIGDEDWRDDLLRILSFLTWPLRKLIWLPSILIQILSKKMDVKSMLKKKPECNT